MRIYVNGRNIEITDAIKAYAKEKIGKVVNHYDQIQAIDIVLSVIKNPSVAQSHTAEVTCKFVTGAVHVTESAESMYASIDLVADKLDRQVKKFKDKSLKPAKSGSIRTDALVEESSEDEEVSSEA
ncbi:TPA: ribosome-associated translation inhibitor RaiA [Candidatus Spyradomonas excrementavium]|nr:ribosome-associated translation inhibitor RaiA [Candidatus Spyradomonas excrementavium]